MKLILFMALSISQLSFAQNEYEYFELQNKADSLFVAHKFRKAAKYYGKALKIDVPERTKLKKRYRTSCAYSMSSKFRKSFKQLENLIDSSAEYRYLIRFSPNDLSNDTLLMPLHRKKRWSALLANAASKNDLIDKSIDSNLVKLITQMGERDQNTRNQIFTIAAEFGYESIEMQQLEREIFEADSINFHLADSIISVQGYPTLKKIGFSASYDFFLIVQHMDLERQLNYLPQLKKCIEEYQAIPGCEMLLEDRVSLRQTGYQLYGSQWCRDLETDAFYICPIIDPINLDRRRFSIALKPMAHEMAESGTAWNLEEYLDKLPEYFDLYQRDKEKINH